MNKGEHFLTECLPWRGSFYLPMCADEEHREGAGARVGADDGADLGDKGDLGAVARLEQLGQLLCGLGERSILHTVYGMLHR